MKKSILNINEEFKEIENLLSSTTVSYELLEKRIRTLFAILIEELSPKTEILIAIQYVENWKMKLINFNEDYLRGQRKMLKEVDKLVQEIMSDAERIKIGLEPLGYYDKNWEPPKEWEKINDLTEFRKLIDQLNAVLNLEEYRKIAQNETINAKAKYRILRVTLQILTGVIFLVGVTLSYIIGLIFESLINFNAIMVAIIVAIICYFTTDNFLNKQKAKLFLKIIKKIISHLKSKYINFINLKILFNKLQEKYPEIFK